MFWGGLSCPERKWGVFTGSLKDPLHELWKFPLSASVPEKSILWVVRMEELPKEGEKLQNSLKVESAGGGCQEGNEMASV